VYLRGDFLDKAPTIQALRNLNVSGYTAADIDVFSDEPIEFPRDVLHRASHMSLTVVTGAITACLLAIGFVYFTQHNYPLVTGGMPLFSFWATGVVFYELTMLGAILTTLVCFLWESGLLRRNRRPTPIIEPGIICIRVHCRPDQVEEARRFLERAGAINVTRMPEAA
jgi:hypothetical protein